MIDQRLVLRLAQHVSGAVRIPDIHIAGNGDFAGFDFFGGKLLDDESTDDRLMNILQKISFINCCFWQNIGNSPHFISRVGQGNVFCAYLSLLSRSYFIPMSMSLMAVGVGLWSVRMSMPTENEESNNIRGKA